MEDTANHIGLTDKQIAAAGEVDKPLLAEGQAFVDQEKACTQTQALKSHWRAAMWSMFLSFALVAEGFDFVTVSTQTLS
jgi:SP family general alpha glucoside:H+ symporter-like MFS transporter